MENLLISWREFLRGKRKRKDVAEFAVHFMDNILLLNADLAAKKYKHGKYEAFKINDPKPRDIHKASVRDRLLHHVIYGALHLFFDRKFIFDSYSCRINKGTHRAINRFRYFARIVSKNNTKTCWVLKCDIQKFFASIDHEILKNILKENIADEDILCLLFEIIDSFSEKEKIEVGLPLGNLTSQLLVNIYMNEFDQFVKRGLKMKYYIRYADDFVFLHEDRKYLENILPKIAGFLEKKLKLTLHPKKVSLSTFSAGIDFLGWVHFTNHRVLRTSTKRRMMRNLQKNLKPESAKSYLGMLSHGNARKLEKYIKNI